MLAQRRQEVGAGWTLGFEVGKGVFQERDTVAQTPKSGVAIFTQQSPHLPALVAMVNRKSLHLAFHLRCFGLAADGTDARLRRKESVVIGSRQPIGGFQVMIAPIIGVTNRCISVVGSGAVRAAVII